MYLAVTVKLWIAHEFVERIGRDDQAQGVEAWPN